MEYKPTTEVAPIWWHTAPMAVYTFLESYDFSGKVIIPFCTSAGSDIEESMLAINQLGSKGKILDGITIKSEADMNKIDPWLKKLGIIN